MRRLTRYFRGNVHPIVDVFTKYLEITSQTSAQSHSSSTSHRNNKTTTTNINLLNKFPPIDKIFISKLSQDISNPQHAEIDFTTYSFFDCLTEIDIENLSKINKNEIPLNEEAAVYVYLNAISFIFIIKQQNDDIFLSTKKGDVYELLSCIQKCLPLDSFDDGTNPYFFQAIVEVILAKKYRNVISEDILSIIISYLFSQDNHLDLSFSPSFMNLLEAVMDGKKDLKKETLILLCKTLNQQHPIISIDENKAQILQIFHNEISTFNKDALDIVAWMSNNAMCKQLNDVYINLPSKFWNHICSKEKKVEIGPQTECPEFEDTKFGQNIPRKNASIFIQKKEKSFPRGMEALPPVFSQKMDKLIEIFDQETQEIIKKLTGLLAKSNQSILVNFFKFFISFLPKSTDDEHFPLFYAAYLLLLKPVTIAKELLDSQFDVLRMTFIFNPKHLIFIDGYLSPLINRLRNEIFDLFIFTDPDRLIKLFDKTKPLLYAEHLGRILSKDHDSEDSVFKKLAENQDFCCDVIKIAKILQQIDITNHSELIAKVRNCVFLFTFNIAQYKRFENKSFGPYFFDFLFEVEITDMIIHIIEKYYISCNNNDINHYDAVVDRIYEALEVCSKRKPQNVLQNDTNIENITDIKDEKEDNSDEKNDENEGNCDIISDEELYSELVIKLTKMIATCMHHNFHSIKLFSKLFDVIADNFISKPSKILLENILDIILYISMADHNFCPPVHHMDSFAQFIKANENNCNTCNDSVYTKIICIIKNTSHFSHEDIDKKNSQLFLIARHKYLPFLIASYGTADFFPRLLKKIHDCCLISWSNLMQCHSGGLDLLFLLYLKLHQERADVDFKGLIVEINLSFRHQSELMLPLIVEICSFRSLPPIAFYFLVDVTPANKQNLSAFIKAVCTSNIMTMDSIPIRPNSPNISYASSLTGTMVKHTFSLTFWMRLDVIAITQNVVSSPEVTLFSLKDGKHSSLSIFVDKSRIYLRYDYNTVRTQVKLIDWPCFQWKESRKETIESSAKWHFVAIMMLNDEKSVSLKTQIDTEKPVKSEMSKLHFHDNEKMNLVIGKSPNSYSTSLNSNSNSNSTTSNSSTSTTNTVTTVSTVSTVSSESTVPSYLCEFGSIGQIRFFQRKLKKIERKQLFLGNKDFVKDDLILEFNADLDQPKPLSMQFEVESYLLDTFLDTLCQFKSCELLSTLKQIFEVSKVTQSFFNMIRITKLSEYLRNFGEYKNDHNHDNCISIKMYLILYSIFEVITDEELKDNWIKEILLNIYIWVRSGNSLKLIISHWSTVLLSSCEYFFRKRSIFEPLIYVFEPSIINTVNCHAYINFIGLVAVFKFTNEDTSTMFNICFSNQSKNYTILYLDILLKICKFINIDYTQRYLEYIHKTFQAADDTEIALRCLQILHNFPKVNVYSEFVISLILLENRNNFSQQKTNLFKLELLEKMISNIEEYPNFFSIISMLSIQINQFETKSKNNIDDNNNSNENDYNSIKYKDSMIKAVDVLQKIVSKNLEISKSSFCWFIWPIILAYNCEHIYQPIIFRFLSYYSKGSVPSIRSISYLLNFLDYHMSSGKLSLPNFVNLLCQNQDSIESMKEIMNICIYTTFWHLEEQNPSRILLKEYMNSDFREYIDVSSTYQTGSETIIALKNIDNLLAMTNLEVDVAFWYHIEIGDDFQIPNNSLLVITNMFLSKVTNCEYLELIQYFNNVESRSPSHPRFDDLFDKMKIDYRKIFSETISSFFTSFRNMILKNREFIKRLESVVYFDKV